MDDLFINATRNGYRYPTSRGEVTTEQLWGMRLQSKGSGFDLDSVARNIYNTIKELSEGSFVETKSNPRLSEAENMLEVVKFIIATKQNEIKLSEKRMERSIQRAKILDALAARENEELTKASRDELLAKLAELESV